MNNLANDISEIKKEKILVGITVQENSKRLIKKSSEIANQKNGQLHILHVQKGNNIFMHKHTPELLQELYQYGSELGGEIYAICGEDICQTIIEFIKKHEIDCMILGEKPKNIYHNKDNDVLKKIKDTFPNIEIIIIQREENDAKDSFYYKHRYA